MAGVLGASFKIGDNGIEPNCEGSIENFLNEKG